MVVPEHRSLLLVLTGNALLVAVLFGPTLYLLTQLWQRDQNYSHGYLVIPISLWLAWRIYRRVGPPQHGEAGWATISLASGLLLQGVATVVRWPPLSYLALLCILRGLLVAAGGRRWASAFTFPLLFLFFMFPLPVVWTGYLSLWLQDVVARISEVVLSLFVVCYRTGHTLRIAGVDRSLIIAEECSGLGQIIAFVAFAALLGHLLQRPGWHRLALLLLAAPTAIIANTLRVILMNLGAAWFGTSWISSVLHDVPALFSLPVGVVLFLLMDSWLSTLGNASPAARADQEARTAPGTSEVPAAGSSGDASLVHSLRWTAAVLTFGAAGLVLLQFHLRQAGEMSFPTLQGPLQALPLAVTDPQTGQTVWQGTDVPATTDNLRQRLPFRVDDVLVRYYRHDSGVTARLYVVYSRAGEDRQHHPEICIRDVQGAPEDVAFRRQIPLEATGPATAARFRFWLTAQRPLLVYYWHYTLEPTPSDGSSRLQQLHQRLGITAPSVTVQLSLSGDEATAITAAEQTLLPALHAGMQQLLPATARCGCDRLPIGLAR